MSGRTSISVRVRRHLRGNVVGYVALFFALSGIAWGAATAPKDSVVTNSIRDGAVTHSKLASGAVGVSTLAPRVLHDSAIASVGRGDTGFECDPTSIDYVSCAQTVIHLDGPGRVLGIGDGSSGAATGDGFCNLYEGADLSNPNTFGPSRLIKPNDAFSIAAVSSVLTAGDHTIGLACYQDSNDFMAGAANLSVISLGAG